MNAMAAPFLPSTFLPFGIFICLRSTLPIPAIYKYTAYHGVFVQKRDKEA
jgi:hypothetical protein